MLSLYQSSACTPVINSNQVYEPTYIIGFLDTEASYTELLDQTVAIIIAVSTDIDGGLSGLKIGQKITFKDARDERPHTMTVL
jgi:hypothetical protein